MISSCLLTDSRLLVGEGNLLLCLVSMTFDLLSTEAYTCLDARRSPKKIEWKPVYVLNLTISPSQVDNFIEPAKSMVRFQVRTDLGAA